MPEEQKISEQPREEKLSNADALKQDAYFWLQALVGALVCLILVFTFLGRIVFVDGESMLPTLNDGDMLVLQSIGYEPQRGDVVVLTKDIFLDKSIVKRVIALGGQTVDIDYDAGTVAVDGEVLDEPYINELMEYPQSMYETITHLEVPEGSIFVMGDNRNHSSDSRNVRCGAIDTRYVMGHVLLIAFPFSHFGGVS
ncbi:MAG: signal peptidase I [Oscillospiraceae bacterium]|nr:signal peptidase I [Oscillospiraceae bacterium]